jgi:hypothetical protein
MVYGGQDLTGFLPFVLTNTGLLAPIRHTGVLLWVEALDCDLRSKLEAIDADSEVAEAMMNRLNEQWKIRQR